MVREDIIRMAREAGMERVIDVHKDGTRTIELPHPDLLERFAALVAAAERKACENLWETLRFTDEKIADHLKAVIEAEREACAKVCDFEVVRLTAIDEPRPALAVGICAAAIRARSNP